MTSMPASRSARAMTLAPRSWPSRPGFAMTTRILPAIAPIVGPSSLIGAGWRALHPLRFPFGDRPYRPVRDHRRAPRRLAGRDPHLLPTEHADPRPRAVRERQ